MQTKRPLEAAVAMAACAIGAGFASGREIMVFFTRFGRHAYWGALAAGIVLGGIAYLLMALYERWQTDCLTRLCARILGPAFGSVAAGFYAAMMVVTGSAMASGMGEIAALTLRIQGAQWVGLVAGVGVCALAAWRGVSALAMGGGLLIPLCLILYWFIGRLPASDVMLIQARPLPGFNFLLPLALCYAAMNGAMCCGILGELGSQLPSKGARMRMSAWVAVIFSGMLVAANAALLPHMRRLQAAPLPMVVLAHQVGPLCVWICVGMLLLAMGTTLMAMLRALAQCFPDGIGQGTRILVSAGLVLILGALGFNNLVGIAYPLLGWGSAVILIVLLIFGWSKPVASYNAAGQKNGRFKRNGL